MRRFVAFAIAGILASSSLASAEPTSDNETLVVVLKRAAERRDPPSRQGRRCCSIRTRKSGSHERGADAGGHAALSTTERYIEADVEAQRKVVELI